MEKITYICDHCKEKIKKGCVFYRINSYECVNGESHTDLYPLKLIVCEKCTKRLWLEYFHFEKVKPQRLFETVNTTWAGF